MLDYAGLEVLVPKGGMLPPGDTVTILLNWKLRLLAGTIGLFTPLKKQAKKGVTVLTGVVDWVSTATVRAGRSMYGT